MAKYLRMHDKPVGVKFQALLAGPPSVRKRRDEVQLSKRQA